MRVNFIGNLANNHYVLAKGLRRLGVDARLYYEDLGFHSLPQADDPELTNAALPHWLVPIPHQFQGRQACYRISPPLLAELARCDLVHAHGVGLIWAAQTGRPFVWHPYGSDLTYLSFYNQAMNIAGWRGPIPIPNLPYLLLPLKMRWAMRRASAVFLGWHNALWREGYRLFRTLNIQDRIRRFHLAIDADRFSPVSESMRDDIRATLLPNVDVQRPLIFHPTRQSFSVGTRLGYKANDRLHRALGEFSRDGGKFTLAIIENGLPDEAIARKIFSEYGISDHVHWIKPRPRHQLIDWYRASDITVESFWTGAIGSVPLESMACGTPVMMHLRLYPELEDDGFFLDPLRLYEELPPIIRCSTVQEIRDQLHSITSEPRRLITLREQCRNWIERFSAIPAKSKRLIALYRSIVPASARPSYAYEALTGKR